MPEVAIFRSPPRLLGVCFWREGIEVAFGPDRRGEKGGWYEALAGKKSPHAGDIGWNFEKFLINSDGKIIARFNSGVEPTSTDVTEKIEKLVK
ncbi:MAG: hypothetical protein P8Q54_17555 [Akkermansiaceae bacterium]|nr:hypothetical protein [Akkermansiaceae bacterium]MDG1365279.1 hypothetical protein [Akkermansiaceae bacterium]